MTLGEFELANLEGDGLKKVVKIPSKWKPPAAGQYKVNTDAAKKSGNMVGFGTVMRDNVGDVMVAACDWIEGDFPTEIMEAMGARFAMQKALEAGLKDIVLETDNAQLCSHLQKRKVEHTDFGLIVGHILKLADSCDSISFSQVRRSGNQVAHYMAKDSFSYNGQRVWIEEYPVTLEAYIVTDFESLEL